jgi:hypothetical protein
MVHNQIRSFYSFGWKHGQVCHGSESMSELSTRESNKDDYPSNDGHLAERGLR